MKERRQTHQPATISPIEVDQARAMLIVHFAIEKRLAQATIRAGRMPGEEFERHGDNWELLDVVLTALRWSAERRRAFSDRCEQIRNTDIRSRGGQHMDVPVIPGVSATAMLIHFDVTAKEERIKRAVRLFGWRLLRLKLTPVVEGCPRAQIRLRSIREVSRVVGRKDHSSIFRVYNRSLLRAAQILVLNEDP